MPIGRWARRSPSTVRGWPAPAPSDPAAHRLEVLRARGQRHLGQRAGGSRRPAGVQVLGGAVVRWCGRASSSSRRRTGTTRPSDSIAGHGSGLRSRSRWRARYRTRALPGGGFSSSRSSAKAGSGRTGGLLGRRGGGRPRAAGTFFRVRSRRSKARSAGARDRRARTPPCRSRMRPGCWDRSESCRPRRTQTLVDIERGG